MFRNEYKANFISIGSLIVTVCTLNDTTLVRLDSSPVRITMTETTLRRMVDFDGCIDVTFKRLPRLDTVDAKYTRFSNTSENAIHNSDFFNRRQLIDCELLTLLFNEKKTWCNNMWIKKFSSTSFYIYVLYFNLHPSIHLIPRRANKKLYWKNFVIEKEDSFLLSFLHSYHALYRLQSILCYNISHVINLTHAR